MGVLTCDIMNMKIYIFKINDILLSFFPKKFLVIHKNRILAKNVEKRKKKVIYFKDVCFISINWQNKLKIT